MHYLPRKWPRAVIASLLALAGAGAAPPRPASRSGSPPLDRQRIQTARAGSACPPGPGTLLGGMTRACTHAGWRRTAPTARSRRRCRQLSIPSRSAAGAGKNDTMNRMLSEMGLDQLRLEIRAAT
jgi:hypothetical protein